MLLQTVLLFSLKISADLEQAPPLKKRWKCYGKINAAYSSNYSFPYIAIPFVTIPYVAIPCIPIPYNTISNINYSIYCYFIYCYSIYCDSMYFYSI